MLENKYFQAIWCQWSMQQWVSGSFLISSSCKSATLGKTNSRLDFSLSVCGCVSPVFICTLSPCLWTLNPSVAPGQDRAADLTTETIVFSFVYCLTKSSGWLLERLWFDFRTTLKRTVSPSGWDESFVKCKWLVMKRLVFNCEQSDNRKQQTESVCDS